MNVTYSDYHVYNDFNDTDNDYHYYQIGLELSSCDYLPSLSCMAPRSCEPSSGHSRLQRC